MRNGERFEKLVEIVEKLRDDDGCPWDKEQTHDSLLPYFLEETYEVMECVDKKNWNALSEELGDVLLHVLFQTDIAHRNGEFQLNLVLEQISDKLVRRHPHVFGDKEADGAFHAKQNWEAAKQQEKKRESRLDGVPMTLPALVQAQRLQQKAAYVGFDWDATDKVWDKVHEEMEELKKAESNNNNDQIEEEVGDLLFTIVNLCRFFDISSEDALRKANRKFTNRFQSLEKELKRQGKKLEETNLAEMDEIWNRQKESPSAQ
ncbi:MAG: nucleoside triphosphate pyrophosphohydrolase [Candidatus Marinimicrobia bacterium]|nr:nucleoside triphosphate pyrophosphohydrolase [Candidatus Neomarinimicrobiota bacterium]|tara:strand:+ start:5828 stop:6610 length:783 start_codon:yes stop_codon:yes gene_type:complete